MNSASRGGRGGRWGNFRGRGGNRGGGGNGNPDRGRGPPAGNGNKGNYTNNGGTSKPRCQVCLKVGHTTLDCWYRFDEGYVSKNKSASAAYNYGADSNWYTDMDATDHITGDLNKLAVHDLYNGNDQIKTANGAGMITNHIG